MRLLAKWDDGIGQRIGESTATSSSFTCSSCLILQTHASLAPVAPHCMHFWLEFLIFSWSRYLATDAGRGCMIVSNMGQKLCLILGVPHSPYERTLCMRHDGGAGS